MTYSLIIHGGAGSGSKRILKNIQKKLNIKNLESDYHNSLKECVRLGENILKNNGSSIDAVKTCIQYLENNKLFNAGYGSVKDINGNFSLDASIMYGKDKSWGAITGCNKVKNPILLVDEIRKDNPRFISGDLNTFDLALKYGLETVNPMYYDCNYRNIVSTYNHDLGTVGAVALDLEGNITAGTSTGGTLNKPSGRIGDTPLIGISTIADNESVGISTTGFGEDIIKNQTASQIMFKYKFLNQNINEAISSTIRLFDIKSSVGIIGLDKKGNIYYDSNTPRMYLGYVSSNQEIKTSLWN